MTDAASDEAGSGFIASPIGARRLQEIYDRTAAFYDEVVAEHQAAAKQFAIKLLDRLPGERFLEVAFGTGWAFLRQIQASGATEAWGIEVAPGMMEVARQKLRPSSEGWPALLLGDICALPFADASFDCLMCTYTLECLPHEMLRPALDELQRLLRPGGRLVLADLTEGEAEDAAMTDEWKRGFEADPEYFGGARPLRLKPLAEAAGFERIERHYSGHGAGWPSEIVLAHRPA